MFRSGLLLWSLFFMMNFCSSFRSSFGSKVSKHNITHNGPHHKRLDHSHYLADLSSEEEKYKKSSHQMFRFAYARKVSLIIKFDYVFCTWAASLLLPQ